MVVAMVVTVAATSGCGKAIGASAGRMAEDLGRRLGGVPVGARRLHAPHGCLPTRLVRIGQRTDEGRQLALDSLLVCLRDDRGPDRVAVAVPLPALPLGLGGG